MSDAVIRAVGLTKVYRLYAKPHYRFLDLFGLLRPRPGAYTEHAALQDVNLEVQRGERVAIIGRNGAGKSTLLKIVTGVVAPTSGAIEVKQGVHALLQIGTGFHPDFTGRENASSYLAHLGVTGREADRKLAEIVEFAELEEYIDQPVKTYSTGMAARLMFATSTVIAPELLVLDEILGVGDAYFAQKSYERIKELCEREGTTVLLVSHDVYSASRLCRRMVWIDRGQIMIDGESAMALKAYEDSIRVQEEQRLRAKKQAALAKAASEERQYYILLEITSHENVPLPGSVFFSDIRLDLKDGRTERVPLSETAAEGVLRSHIEVENSCWGTPEIVDNRLVRPLRNHGSPYHKGTAVFVPDSVTSGEDLSGARFVLEYRTDQSSRLALSAYLPDRKVDLGTLPTPTADWSIHEVLWDEASQRQASPRVSTRGIYGSGAIVVADVRLMNHLGQESFELQHGLPMALVMSYELRRPDFAERAQVLFAFYRDGIHDVCRTITRDLVFDARQQVRGHIVMQVPKFPLANGKYAVSVMVAKEGYYDSNPTLFFSVNPDVYCCLSKVIEFSVVGAGTVGTGTGVVLDADWGLLGSSNVQAPYHHIVPDTSP